MPAYHETHRPTKFAHVAGHRAIIHSLVDVLEADTSHAFMFTGSAGIGKTTLARVAADFVNCQKIEIDAATHSGVDHMREITELARYTVAGMSRAIIIDECHRLSGQAWDALLKITEEPGKKLYWFLCSTDPTKVPKTIKTRCTTYELQPLKTGDVRAILYDVIDEEKLDVPKDIVDLVAEQAHGSARDALTNLAKVAKLNFRDAEEVLLGASAKREVIDLARFVLKGSGSWNDAMDLVTHLKDDSPEGVRIIISNYLGKVLRGAENDNEAMRLLGVIKHWVTPYATNEGITPLMVSIGNSLFITRD